MSVFIQELAIVIFLSFTHLQLEISNFLGVPGASHAVFCNTKVNCPDIPICSHQNLWWFPTLNFCLWFEKFRCRVKNLIFRVYTISCLTRTQTSGASLNNSCRWYSQLNQKGGKNNARGYNEDIITQNEKIFPLNLFFILWRFSFPFHESSRKIRFKYDRYD